MLNNSDPNWLTDEQYQAASPEDKKAAEGYQKEAGKDPFAGCKGKQSGKGSKK